MFVDHGVWTEGGVVDNDGEGDYDDVGEDDPGLWTPVYCGSGERGGVRGVLREEDVGQSVAAAGG